VSHSFVRREIEGVDAAGHTVLRFTMRPPRGDLRDEADLREAALTESVLAQGLPKLVSAALLMLARRPAKTFAALDTAWRLAGPGLKSKSRHFAYWLEAAWLVRRLDQLRIEHLHAHFGTNPAAVAAIVRAWGGPPFSFTAHGPDEFDAPVQLSLGRKVAASAFAATISSYGRSQLMRWSDPADWEKIKVIRCGLGSDFIDAQTVGVPKESIELLCVARLSAQKGLPLLLSACARLKETGERFMMTIVGDGELRPNLETQIDRLAVGDCVRLLGVQSSAEIRGHLERARAFVLPSFAEGLPVVLMEALAMARPVVTSAIAGIPELVDEQCGWLIPAGSEEALERALSDVLNAPPEELDRRGEAGRERVRQLHNARRNAVTLVEAIEEGRTAIRS
jgi:colanic acid/amylovoran biosynthesis glycosyltransferase